MTVFYFAPAGGLGDLEQAKRECRALLAALEDPQAAATMMQGMPETLAAYRKAHGLRAATVEPMRPVVMTWDDTDGQVALAVREVPQ